MAHGPLVLLLIPKTAKCPQTKRVKETYVPILRIPRENAVSTKHACKKFYHHVQINSYCNRKNDLLTLVLLNPYIPCLCKQHNTDLKKPTDLDLHCLSLSM